MSYYFVVKIGTIRVFFGGHNCWGKYEKRGFPRFCRDTALPCPTTLTCPESSTFSNDIGLFKSPSPFLALGVWGEGRLFKSPSPFLGEGFGVRECPR